ncbi:hypothetical protein D9M71_245980 [compost metagenome]
MVILEAAFDEVNVFSHVVFATCLVRQERLDHVLGHARPHQAGEVGFDAVTQAPQGIGSAFVEWQIKVAQCLFHFFLRRFCPQRFCKLRGELLGRGSVQFAALRAAHVIHGAGFGGAGLFGAGVGEQRDQGEHQYVGRQ